jgi:PHD/YefM family antitoxin component YafN of YafNO toxin-antitoxin module
MQESRYITDENGERTAVILSIEEYERLMEAVEDLEDLEHIKAARETRARIEAGEEETIPWEQARGRIGSEYSEPADF